MTEVEQLRHRLTMVNDDLKVLIAFIYEKGLNTAFGKRTEHSDNAWVHLNNIEIACDLESDESLGWTLYSKKYRYCLTQSAIECSFDYGEITASNIDEARSKAIEKLRYDFKKANDALEDCDVTKVFTLNFYDSDVEVVEIDEINGL